MPDLLTILLVAALAIAIVPVLVGILRRRSADRGSDGPRPSLVLLLEAPRQLDEEHVRCALERAFEIQIDADDGDAQNFVVEFPELPGTPAPPGMVTAYLAKANGQMAMVHHWAMRYDDEGDREMPPDGRLQVAIERHQAWLAVDHAAGAADATAQYRFLGRLIAELAGPDTLAIYYPAEARLNVWRPELVEQLRGSTPLALFGEPSISPVVCVPEDDERMAAAVAKARALWPEFEREFHASGPDAAPFLVKAPFSGGGHTEFMWVRVSAIEDGEIHGILENEPFRVTGYEEGQQVTTRASEINDVAFLQADEPRGGFTLEVLGQGANSPD